MKNKKRLDILLFERKLVDSRASGQALIMAGQVLVNGKKETKPGSSFDDDSGIEILETSKYVGRGAEKLEKAYEEFKIDFKDKIVADIGSSTGGFTDFALQYGAKKVYAIDVGTGQLHWKLRNDPRVVVMEKTDFRKIESLPEAIDIFVVDVSFISLRKILPVICRVKNQEPASPAGRSKIKDSKKQNHDSKFMIHNSSVIALFKPQFEAGKAIADKFKGVIKDPKIHDKLLKDFKKWCEENEFEILGETESPIKGAKGNTEFLFLLRI